MIENAIMDDLLAGRNCPLDYVTPHEGFRRAADFGTETIYVAGGLYGNLFALDAIEKMVSREPGAVLVFNGDCHWLDCDFDLFEEIESRLAPYRLLRGNVETEISREENVGAGCGCAYPPYVDQGVVDRSNRIHAQLAAMMSNEPAIKERLRTRPPTAIANIGGVRVGIVHGDAHSIAGWGFDMVQLDDTTRHAERTRMVEETGLSIFASSHTCTAATRHYADIPGGLTIANNGGAGLPNFAGSPFGLVTRIATSPSPHPTIYGLKHHGLTIDALPVMYDHIAFVALFDRLWPEGSDGAIGYRERVLGRMHHRIEAAARGHVNL